MKFKNYFIGVSVFAVALLSSCAKLPVYQSKSVAGPLPVNSSSEIANEYNPKKHIDYGVSTDNENLYLQLCFHDQKHMAKMLEGGLNIYLDKSGKKKKDCVLVIEKSPNMQKGNIEGEGMKCPGQGDGPSGGNRENPQGGMERPEMGGAGGDKPEMRNEGGLTDNIPSQICKKLNLVSLEKNQNEIIYYSTMFKDKVEVKFEPYNFTYLMLSVRIPYDEINIRPGEELALGIETIPVSSSSEMKQGGGFGQEGMSGGPGGGPGGGGGGRGPGMGGGPGGAGGTGGMPEGNMGGVAQSSTQISGASFKFWFLTQL
ncbi:hypothetical protein SLH46_06015 [Draconibacterium sp. IB214405]|uniref:hypothetical protein n=1 Tax=Draconibacterium sp. IB214405 TaxID=3097352 RepID=UPI002A0C282C|nr:hypothetical protein [Draconibacterium sp. IB214405]MDX8338727.1 hypothetical protein [Draconibacterium sp. IB214405]